MWDIKTFGSASEKMCRHAASLRTTVSTNGLDDSRLPDLVALSHHFDKLCLPFRDHDVDSFAPQIYEVLRKHGERQVIVLENPLYDNATTYVAEVNIFDSMACQRLIAQQFFSGGFIIGTKSSHFTWIGNFTDYGFMFADPEMIEEVFGCSAFTAYCTQTCEFRLNHGGDPFLDSKIRGLDKLWSATSR